MRDRILTELKGLRAAVAIPSVSADPAMRPHVVAVITTMSPNFALYARLSNG